MRALGTQKNADKQKYFHPIQQMVFIIKLL